MYEKKERKKSLLKDKKTYDEGKVTRCGLEGNDRRAVMGVSGVSIRYLRISRENNERRGDNEEHEKKCFFLLGLGKKRKCAGCMETEGKKNVTV